MRLLEPPTEGDLVIRLKIAAQLRLLDRIVTAAAAYLSHARIILAL